MKITAFSYMVALATLALASCDQAVDEDTPKLRTGSSDPCEQLTPAAIQAVVDYIDSGLAKAEEHLQSDPEWYAAHAEWAVDLFMEAREQLVDHQTWLVDNQYDSPFISNPTAAWSTHIIAREASWNLLVAESYEAVGATWNASLPAKTSAEFSGQATELLAAISSDGINCYMSTYFP